MTQTPRPTRSTAGRPASANVVTQGLTLRWAVLPDHRGQYRLSARWTE